MTSYRLDFDPGLAEEAVLRAIAAGPAAVERRFRQRRDPLYEIGDEERREAAFRELHGRWLERLGLVAACRRMLAEEPAVETGTSRGIFVAAASAKAEYADLRNERQAARPAAAARPVLTVALRPETLADTRRLEGFLARELVFVADLLDPGFGFRPAAELGGGGLEKLIVQRYRLLWETSVDGRLDRRGRLPAAAAERRRMEFDSVFGMLGEAAPRAFERYFRGPRPGHEEMASFARDPRAACGLAGSGIACPICGMPSFRRHPDASSLPGEVVTAIRVSSPGWRPDQGLCLQCADLFLARTEADSAAASTARRP